MPLLRRVFTQMRVVSALLGVLVVALVLETWMRLRVTLWLRRDTPSWHRAWNSIVKTWGIWTAEVTMFFLDLRLEVRGTIPASGRYLVVANHQSSIDVPFLIHILRRFDLKFVAHSGLKYGKPFVSYCLRNGGFAFLNKTNLLEDQKGLREFAAGLEDNQGSPMIFPEGIRTFDGTIGPFGIAAMHTVEERTGLPILPIVHDGLWTARTIREVDRLVGTTLQFVILDPVPPERFADDPRSAYGELEASLREELAKLRGGA